VAAVESPDALQSLVGDVADVDRPAYRQLRQQCREICNAVPDVRYVYLLAERGGKVVFLLDTEPDQVTGRGGEPTATPGDKYDEATAQMRGVFQTGRAIAEGPYTDKWGSFVSGLAPVRHPETGGVIGVLGIDINASRWASIISSVRLWAILVTALIAGLMLFFFVLWRKSHEEAEADSVARDRLQRQQAALVKIATSHAVATGDFQAAARCITEMTVGAVGVERAGIWMGSYQEGRLYCADIYDRTACQHAEGLVLNATSYPEYFKALETGRAIDASDCTKDPPLSEMLDLCRERGVVSALDAPIRVSGALVGVVCLEHTGASRQWLPDEVRFVAEVADQVAHVLINVERKKAIEALEKAHHELEARVRDRTAGLSLANEGLRKEIIERKRVEVERDRIEEKLRQAKKMECLGVLAGGIAHDFNNILMAILGNLELARMELSPGMPVLEYLNDADKAARRASELSRQMLAYSGRAKFLVQSVSLNDVIRDMIPTITSTVANAAQVVWKYGDDLPAVEVDVAQIRQILLNLVTNASEAMGESGGTIHLITGIVHCDRERLSRAWLPDNLKEGFYVFLEVIDTGCGMEAHTRERIFDPFFTTKFTGRGLGLPAVLGIVRGHGGAIELESTFGQGTTVRLLFPSSFTPLSRCAAELPCPEGWKGHGTILLVDDEDPVRLLGVKLLDRLGFRSLTACDGLEAVQVFREHQDEITCVLLDLTMPRMDGRETLLALKRIKSGVRVMLCSGYAEEEAVAHFNEVPPDGFIQKPYSLDDLACKLMVVTSGAQDTSVK
jgi:signal transduction histidine kinase/ActR/RegA family two-component response regulator